jgi:hypothetical protein
MTYLYAQLVSSTFDGIRVFLLVFSGSINWWDFPIFDYTFLEKCQKQGEIVSHNIKTSDKICSVFGGTLIEWKNLWGISKNKTPTPASVPFSKMSGKV